MESARKQFKLLPVFALMTASLACQLLAPEPGSTPPDRTPQEADEVSVNRITYVNSAGDVFTIAGDGADRQQLTGGTQVGSGPTGPFMAQTMDFNNFFAWPTWSPDGTKLAVSRVRGLGDQDAEVTIQLLDAVTGLSRTLYETDFSGLVADGSPHYLYWSPDSKSLSFLASTPTGLSLFVTGIEPGDSPSALESGAPLYYSWSGDGASLVVHIGDEVKLYRDVSASVPSELLATARGFRVPAFSPDGRSIAYVNQAESGSVLLVADLDDLDNPTRVAEVGAFSAFMWSPDGMSLAVADQAAGNAVAFERMRLISADGSAESTITEELLLAFYWSPDSSRVAWVGLEREQRTFDWNVATVSGDGAGESRTLFNFNPSRDVFTMLSFFDQYAYSHSPWSPDSSHLVVAGTQTAPFERRNGHTPTGARVFVLDALGSAPPQEIAEGTLAFWSWN